MNARGQRASELLHAALRLQPSERARFLDHHCNGDEELRRELEILLAAGDMGDPVIATAVTEAITNRLAIGQQVGAYRITGLLGVGGMGIVYKAEDTRLQRIVALKFLRNGFSERFLREAKAICSLNHPHIAMLYDIGAHDGAPYLVLEYVEGNRLKGPLPLATALEYAIQIAGALEAAHAADIVHRDIKPANILVSPRTGVKVLDFGLARRAHRSETETTVTGELAGTAPYMSPEQAEGLPVDTRSDIFSFGCVLYEMISGRRAFQGKSVASVIAALMEREPEPLTGIPPELRQIVCRCIRKTRERRWQHIGDVRILLEELRDETSRCAAARPKPSRKWRIMAITAACIVLAGLGYFAWKRRPVASVPSQIFRQVTDDAGQEVSPSLSPDGKTVVYASRAAGNWDIYSLRVGGKNPINLTKDSPADDIDPAFSPEGDRIAFRSERDGGGIFIMGATGESAHRLTNFCYLPAWSPDAKQLACSTVHPYRPDVREVLSSQIFVVDVETGKSRLVSGGVMDAVQPSWSPDGRRIAFWGLREGARDIFTVTPEATDITTVTQDDALDWNPVWAPDGKHLYFSSDRGGAMNVWRVLIDTDGKPAGVPEPVDVPATYAAGMTFSRDGRHMAYVNVLRRSNLFRCGFDPLREITTGAPEPITQGVKETLYPAISPNGKQIAFTMTGSQEDIVTARTDGTDMRRITEDPARHRAPRWSPDGSRIAFMSSRTGRYEIWMIHPDGSGLTQVTDSSPRGGVNYPVWSPDGRHLSYNLPDEMGYIIDVSKPWKDQQPRLVRAQVPEGSWFWVNDWSHDGRNVAGTIQRLDGGTLGIASYSLRTRTLEPITSFGQLPRWLPDGRRLIFHSQGRLYVADPAAKKTKEILTIRDGIISPYFDVSWDGRTIVFAVEAVESDIWMGSAR